MRPAVLAALLVSGVAVLANQPQQPIRVGTNFVRVDAYPMKDGKPVFDLKAEEFEVFEDGVLQKIESFEHVVVRPAGAQTERVEPSSQRESLQAAANPRNRVFVVFLDTPFVTIEGAHKVNEPLIRLIDNILGPDDLVGVMTPAMAASQVVLGRKTQVIEDSLRKNWAWGDRFTLRKDEREYAYMYCYPPLTNEKGEASALARELITRKRERATLEALEDLVRYLRSIREERKAILIVTEGWLLYRENKALMALRKDPLTSSEEPVPGLDPIGVGPTGKLTTKDPRRIDEGSLTKTECDTRLHAPGVDGQQAVLPRPHERGECWQLELLPRGPARPCGVRQPRSGLTHRLPSIVDHAMLRERIEVMRTLAGNTDGIAVVNSNDLDVGMRRISDDLTSYYLLGYYSTNAKQDGGFRALKVKVKQPGVEVRARRGYRARNGSRAHRGTPRRRRTRSRGHARSQRGDRQAGARPAGGAIPHQRCNECRWQAHASGLQASCKRWPDGQTTLPRAGRPTSRPPSGRPRRRPR